MKIASRIAVLVVIMAATTTAFAQMDKVSNTPHNLNNWPGLSIDTPRGSSQVCLPCHVPHNAYPTPGATNPILEVLWNHAETTLTFDMYTTRSGQTGDQPQGASKMCLSCHDGVTAIDSYGGMTGSIVLTGSVAIGADSDLTDDHPIGIVYPIGDPGYHDPAGFQGVQLVTVGGETDRVECTSCHEPHNNALGAFLRRELNESLICLECHDK